MSKTFTAEIKVRTSMLYEKLTCLFRFYIKNKERWSHCIAILTKLRSGFIECRAGEGEKFIELGWRNRQRWT